jgi:hypothetical protein
VALPAVGFICALAVAPALPAGICAQAERRAAAIAATGKAKRENILVSPPRSHARPTGASQREGEDNGRSVRGRDVLAETDCPSADPA